MENGKTLRFAGSSPTLEGLFVSGARPNPVSAAADSAALKKPSVSVFLGYPFYDEILAAAVTEPVKGPSAFIREILAFGFQIYRRVGSLKGLRELREELETLSPGAGIARMSASKETYVELHVALGLILERAPQTVIAQVAELLTRYAGQYAPPPEAPPRATDSSKKGTARGRFRP